jgi:hypothetical protein
VESIAPVEVLPHNGVLIKVIHKDKTVHEWEAYSSAATVIAKRKLNPMYITCPKCGDLGRVNQFRHYTRKSKNIIDYVITHEKIEGKWGKHPISKRRRCYMVGPQRDIVLKKLGRLPV